MNSKIINYYYCTNIHVKVAVYFRITLIVYAMLCYYLFIDSEYSDEYKRGVARNRRESVAGLIPFPRVGRSGINTDLQMENLCTYI